MKDAMSAITLGMRKAGLAVPAVRRNIPNYKVMAINNENPDRRAQQTCTRYKVNKHIHTKHKQNRPQQTNIPNKQTPTKPIRRRKTWRR